MKKSEKYAKIENSLFPSKIGILTWNFIKWRVLEYIFKFFLFFFIMAIFRNGASKWFFCKNRKNLQFFSNFSQPELCSFVQKRVYLLSIGKLMKNPFQRAIIELSAINTSQIGLIWKSGGNGGPAGPGRPVRVTSIL